MSVCRFCGGGNREKSKYSLVKYGVRHYAHPDCGLMIKGAAFLDTLSVWELGQFPYFLAERQGVLERLNQLLSTKGYKE
jgi:hypothetical protein